MAVNQTKLNELHPREVGTYFVDVRARAQVEEARADIEAKFEQYDALIEAENASGARAKLLEIAEADVFNYHQLARLIALTKSAAQGNETAARLAQLLAGIEASFTKFYGPRE